MKQTLLFFLLFPMLAMAQYPSASPSYYTTNAAISDSSAVWRGLIDGRQATLSGTGFVKISGTTISYDNSTYLTAIANSYITNGMLAGSIAASKLVGSDIATVGTVTTGTWSATAIADGKIASALTGKTYNGLSVTSSTGTLTIANGKTLIANNSLTLSGTDGSTLNMGTGGTLGTNAYTSTSYQPLATNLTSIGALANASGFLKNNGSGTFTYENPAGAGTVTDASVVSANGFAGTVATSTSTPAITISTTITGLLKGNGTAISAATAGTDYVTPTGIGMPVYAQVTGSNATTTGQALTDITGLSVALTTNATYEFEAVMSVSTSAVTTGTAYGVQYSVAGATVEAQITGASTSTASKTLRINALNSATALYLATSAQTGGIVIKGRITTGANAGNLTIQHLKLTSGTSTIFIGSFLKVTRIQ